MQENKMHLINKIFNNETIRIIWAKEDEKYYISIIDIVAVLTKSTRPRKYWSDLKKKMIEEGHVELSENIGQLKLKSSDGKHYRTDVLLMMQESLMKKQLKRRLYQIKMF